MELNKAIQNRHSVRKFSSKKPDWRTIIECIDASRYAPMAGKIYTVRFILVDNKESIKKIAEASHQDFVSPVKYIVVVCSELSKVLNAFGERAKIYCRQQAGAAIQNFLLKIEDSGLATCWVGDFVEEQVKRELRIPDNINVEAIFPVGYEFMKAKTRRAKADIDRILYFNNYKNSKMKSPRRGN